MNNEDEVIETQYSDKWSVLFECCEPAKEVDQILHKLWILSEDFQFCSIKEIPKMIERLKDLGSQTANLHNNHYELLLWFATHNHLPSIIEKQYAKLGHEVPVGMITDRQRQEEADRNARLESKLKEDNDE